MTCGAESLHNHNKDIHTDDSVLTKFQEEYILPGDLNEWVRKTYNKYGVNLCAFCFSYLEWFWQSPEVWPKNRKKKREDSSYFTPNDALYWRYDCKPADNRFNINDLYRRIPKKAFMKGRKADLEALMMYIWLFEIGGSNDGFWPEFCNEYEEKIKSEL